MKVSRIEPMFSPIFSSVRELARLVLARWIADFCGAPAHQYDGSMTGLLQPVQHHDRDQISDMQAVGGRVVSDIGGDNALGRARVEGFDIRALVQETARNEGLDEL